MSEAQQQTLPHVEEAKNDSPLNASFHEALCNFQQDIGPIFKDKSAKLWKSDKEHAYASREQVFKQVLEAAKKHGFFVAQNISHMEHGFRVQTLLTHFPTKESCSFFYDFKLKLNGELGPQDSGKLTTYASRYALRFALGLTDTDELEETDDDGASTQNLVDDRNILDGENNIKEALKNAETNDDVTSVYNDYQQTIQMIEQKDKKAFTRIKVAFTSRRAEIKLKEEGA